MNKIIKSVLHKLAHLFNLQLGTPYSWHDGDDLMMGFKCDTCDDIAGVHKSSVGISLRLIK